MSLESVVSNLRGSAVRRNLVSSAKYNVGSGQLDRGRTSLRENAVNYVPALTDKSSPVERPCIPGLRA